MVARLFDIDPSPEWQGFPLWDPDRKTRDAVVSSTMNTHGQGVKTIPEKLHISVRTPELAVMWWADDTPEEYFTRTTAGEVRVDPDHVSSEFEQEVRRDIEERADKVEQDSKVGGDVTERLRDLGYVEEASDE